MKGRLRSLASSLDILELPCLFSSSASQSLSCELSTLVTCMQYSVTVSGVKKKGQGYIIVLLTKSLSAAVSSVIGRIRHKRRRTTRAELRALQVVHADTGIRLGNLFGVQNGEVLSGHVLHEPLDVPPARRVLSPVFLVQF